MVNSLGILVAIQENNRAVEAIVLRAELVKACSVRVHIKVLHPEIFVVN